MHDFEDDILKVVHSDGGSDHTTGNANLSFLKLFEITDKTAVNTMA